MGKAKQWKTGGVEDKLLRKLIKNGKINKYTKPATLQSDHPAVFGGFSSQVMRNHLTIVKRASGLLLDGDDDSDEAEEEAEEQEAASTSAGSDTLNTPHGENTDFNAAPTGDKALHLNYPVIIKTFVCPITQTEKVLMVVSLPGGAENLKIELQDDGFWVYVKYTWPKTMFDARDLFKSQLDAGDFKDYHPIVTCFQAGLTEVRKRIDLAPDGLIKVFLPVKVQTAPDSYKIWGVKRSDGAQIGLAEFTCFVKVYFKKASEEKVKFL